MPGGLSHLALLQLTLIACPPLVRALRVQPIGHRHSSSPSSSIVWTRRNLLASSSAALLLPRRAADGHTLELNPDHPLVIQLAQGVAAEEGEDVVRERAELLAQLGAVATGVGAVNQAALAERLARAAAAAPPPQKRRRDAAGGWLRRIFGRS